MGRGDGAGGRGGEGGCAGPGPLRNPQPSGAAQGLHSAPGRAGPAHPQASITLRPRYPQEAVGPSMRGLPAAGCVPRQGGRRRCGAVRCLRPSWQLLPCLPAGRCRFRTKLGASVVYGVLRVKCRHLWFRACQSRHIVYLCFLIWGLFWRGESEW